MKSTWRQMARGAIGLAIVMTAAGPALAQAGDVALGQRVFREIANCHDCHGWAGDGVPDIPQFEGANLRLSQISLDAALETIRCGRPGTLMPSFRRNTYTEAMPCYGMTAPLPGNMQPADSDAALSDRYINSVVAFLFEQIIGAGPVTKEYCESVFGAGAAKCEGYPTAAEAEAAAPPAAN